jgi:hypothetical protein
MCRRVVSCLVFFGGWGELLRHGIVAALMLAVHLQGVLTNYVLEMTFGMQIRCRTHLALMLEIS